MEGNSTALTLGTMDPAALLDDLDAEQRHAVATDLAAGRRHRRGGFRQDQSADPPDRAPRRDRDRRRPPHARAHVHPRGGERTPPPASAPRARRTGRGRHVPLGDARSAAPAVGRPQPARRRRSSTTGGDSSARSPGGPRSTSSSARSTGPRHEPSRPRRTPSEARRAGRKPPQGVDRVADRVRRLPRPQASSRRRRPRRRAQPRSRCAAPRRRLRSCHSMALPASARRRGAGPQPGPAPTRRPAAPRSQRPVPRRRPGAGHLRLQRHRPELADRGRATASPASRSSASRRTTAARRRSSKPAPTSSPPVGSLPPSDPADPTVTACVSSTAPTRSTRRSRSRGSSPTSIPAWSARAGWPCSLARTPSSSVSGPRSRRPASRSGDGSTGPARHTGIRWVRPHGRAPPPGCGRGRTTSSTGSVPTDTRW